MRLRITIAMLEIRNRKTLQSKVNICKSDVKIGDYADSLLLILTPTHTHMRHTYTHSGQTKFTVIRYPLACSKSQFLRVSDYELSNFLFQIVPSIFTCNCSYPFNITSRSSTNKMLFYPLF